MNFISSSSKYYEQTHVEGINAMNIIQEVLKDEIQKQNRHINFECCYQEKRNAMGEKYFGKAFNVVIDDKGKVFLSASKLETGTPESDIMSEKRRKGDKPNFLRTNERLFNLQEQNVAEANIYTRTPYSLTFQQQNIDKGIHILSLDEKNDLTVQKTVRIFEKDSSIKSKTLFLTPDEYRKKLENKTPDCSTNKTFG